MQGVNQKVASYSFRYKTMILLSILVIFFCAQFPSDKIKHILNGIIRFFDHQGNILIVLDNTKLFTYFIGPIKAFFFLVSLVILFFPFIKELSSGIIFNKIKYHDLLKKAGIICLTISILVIPYYLKSMGKSYGNLSADPFIPGYNLLSSRILMPALAFFLQLKGPVLYFIFTLGLIFLFTFLLQFWFDNNKIRLNYIYIISILTCSFYIFQFQYPGYPDILLYIFFILILIFRQQDLLKIILFSLSLATHEAALFILIPYFFFFEERKLMRYISAITFLYLLIWVFSFGFDFYKGINTHNLGDEWVIEKVINNPLEYFKGLFFSYKLLWIAIFIYPFLFIKNSPGEVVGVLFIFLGSILVTLLAVDTSRLAGLSFIGFLFIIRSYEKADILSHKSIKILLMANLIIPSFYYSLNTGLVSFQGLYKWIYQIF